MQDQDTPSVGDDRKLVKTSTPGIFKRGDSYVVRFRDSRGKQKKRFARTLAEARTLKAELTADVARGEFRQLSRTTFGEYAPTWIETYAGRTSRGIRDATRDEYAVAIGLDPKNGYQPFEPPRAAIAFFDRMRLTEIEPRDVKNYALAVSKRGLSRNTVRLAVAPVKALLATALDEGLIRSNPSAGLRLPQATQAKTTVDEDELAEEKVMALTEEELRALLAAVPDDWRLMLTFLAHTGVRISEALPLRWRDIDFGTHQVRIRRALSRGKIGPPKSKYGRRDIPLTKAMSTALWNRRKTAGVDGRDEALVFPGASGAYLSRGAPYRVVKTAAKKAGVPWAGLHTLRHSAASILFRNGVNAKQVQMWLGHHSPAFTLAVYVHLLPGDLPDPTCMDAATGPIVVASGPVSGPKAAQVTSKSLSA